MEGGEDLGGREPPLERGGSLPPNLPLSPRTFPQNPAVTGAKICFAFVVAGFCGKVFLSDWEVRDFLQGAAIALFLWVGNIYETHSTNQSGAKPHCQKTPPAKPKTFPKSTRQSKAKQIIAMQRRVLLGKVFLLLGETRISCRVRLSHSFCGGHISQICPARVPAGGILALT